MAGRVTLLTNYIVTSIAIKPPIITFTRVQSDWSIRVRAGCTFRRWWSCASRSGSVTLLTNYIVTSIAIKPPIITCSSAFAPRDWSIRVRAGCTINFPCSCASRSGSVSWISYASWIDHIPSGATCASTRNQLSAGVSTCIALISRRSTASGTRCMAGSYWLSIYTVTWINVFLSSITYTDAQLNLSVKVSSSGTLIRRFSGSTEARFMTNHRQSFQPSGWIDINKSTVAYTWARFSH